MKWQQKAVQEFGVKSLDLGDLVSLAAYDSPDEPFLVPLIDLYLETGPKTMQAIQLAAANGDQRLLHNSAHGLKSTSAQLGAKHLASLCLELERATDRKLPALTGLQQKLPELSAEFQRACRDLGVVRCLLTGEDVPAKLKVGA